MPCYTPLRGWRAAKLNETGKRGIVFKLQDAYKDKPIDVPCGQCVGCRLERSRQWAIRCMHEASLFDRNCFLTLTYDERNVNPNGSLVPRDMVLFLKRLRKQYGEGIRFFQCGEYGENTSRPHHHVLLFNHDFDDKKRCAMNGGNTLYTSMELERLWPHGQNWIGAVTFESAAYVARYCTKKITGPSAAAHYGNRVPEYATMSRRPGIGIEWYRKFQSDVFPADEVVIRGGIKCRPPRFYESKFEVNNATTLQALKRKRKIRAMRSPDNTTPRMIVRFDLKVIELKQAMIRRLERGY